MGTKIIYRVVINPALPNTGILDTELLQGAGNGQEDTTQKALP